MDESFEVRSALDVQNVLQDMVVVSAGVGEFLDGLVEAAVAVLGGAESVLMVSATLLRPRTRATIVGSSRMAWQLTDMQYRFDDGPSLQVAATGRTAKVDDADADTRFPLYLSAAARSNVRSVLCVPLRLDGPERATLTLYSRRRSAFCDESVGSAELFAQRASTSLKLAVRLARLTDKADHLSAAMKSRTTIDLAAGIIMAQNRCTQDEAIEILRAASSARNMKLRDLAAFVLSNTSEAAVTTHFD